MRFETVSYEDAADFEGAPFDALAAHLREHYPRTHAALGIEKVNGYTLLYEWKGTDRDLAPALFMSHTDVVPVEAEAAAHWSHPPYGGVIADGQVWGRGAIDEEIGGQNGAKQVASLFESRGIRLAFLFDEGGMVLDGHSMLPGQLVANVVTAEKAYYTVELIARGISGHSVNVSRSITCG